MKKILAVLFMTLLYVTSMSASEVTASSDKTFSDDIKRGYVLVDFWATWCPPCRALAPIYEDLSEEFSGQVKFLKLDVDKSPQTATQYGIRSIPTLILFKDGKIVEKWIGGKRKEDLRNLIKAAIQ